MIIIGNAKRILTIIFAVLAFAGIIGLIIACLNVIPSGKGGSMLDEAIDNLYKPAVTTPASDGDQNTPSGNNTTTTPSGGGDETPDKVDNKGCVVLFNEETNKYENINYSYVFDYSYKEGVGNWYYAPILLVKVEPGLAYNISFNATACALGDNRPGYYDIDENAWSFASVGTTRGEFTGVMSDSDGYIRLLLAYTEEYRSTDISYYYGIRDNMESKGFVVELMPSVAG